MKRREFLKTAVATAALPVVGATEVEQPRYEKVDRYAYLMEFDRNGRPVFVPVYGTQLKQHTRPASPAR